MRKTVYSTHITSLYHLSGTTDFDYFYYHTTYDHLSLYTSGVVGYILLALY